MVRFEEISLKEFLENYWQKKPLVIRNALPGFISPLTANELAGLAMEEEIESRIVFETPQKAPYWHLKRGPFAEKDFAALAETHWTLLVQGVDRFIPEIFSLLGRFDFIPQWRLDDVMISYAVEQGSVGPHYDNYDVFLYQAQGRRRWTLTTKNCNEENYLAKTELRIMRNFEVEEEYILEEGDMLYLPPHVGHYGISLSSDCMTYSFGYRSYQGQEIWDSFAEYLSERKQSARLYQDPNWSLLENSAEISPNAWLSAKKLMIEMLDDEKRLQTWFGCFVTRLDHQAEILLPRPLKIGAKAKKAFITKLSLGEALIRNPLCRFAYQHQKDGSLIFFANGELWEQEQGETHLVKLVANFRSLHSKELSSFLDVEKNQLFLFELWRLRWLEFTGS